MSWEFLIDLLEKRGFGSKFRSWVEALLLSASTKILINGELSDGNEHAQGLRQGDPLSPLLFILVMGCLAALMDRAAHDGILGPIGKQNIPFRTTLYADDAILFINPLSRETAAVKAMLHLFGDATGLMTNLAKSSVTPMNCQEI